MRSSSLSLTLSSLLVVCPLLASAQTPPVWRVVAGDSAQVVAPDLPAGTSRQLLNPMLADRGQDRIGFFISTPAALAGYWAWQGGRFQRWSQTASTGATGPGRSGQEANHQFLDLRTTWGEAATDGQRLLLARAGNPAQTENASFGLWRWNGSANIEIARGATDGVLGPGFGSNWVFPNSSSSVFSSAQAMAGGQAMIFAEVTSPSGADVQAVLRHVPGQGNRPCLRTLTSEAGLNPGLNAGDSFPYIVPGTRRFAVTPDARVFAMLAVSNSGRGLFELCDGAPRGFAAINETGVRGPDTGDIGAIFTDLERPHPTASGRVTFFARWRVPPGTTRTALFQQDAGRNRPLAYVEASGFYGPNWMNATWSSFEVGSLSVAGEWAAFRAGVSVAGGGSPFGLWRVRAGDRPQLLALIGLNGAPYEPEPGRTWRSFEAFAVLSDGRVVLDATTDAKQTRDLWLLAPGRPPQRLLSIGQTLTVPTSQGSVQATVSSYLLPGESTPETGDDGWVAADGQLLVSANTAALGRLLITTRLEQPDPNTLFRDGFE